MDFSVDFFFHPCPMRSLNRGSVLTNHTFLLNNPACANLQIKYVHKIEKEMKRRPLLIFLSQYIYAPMSQ